MNLVLPIGVNLNRKHIKYLDLFFHCLQVLDKWVNDVNAKFESEFAAADSYAPTLHEWLASNWQGKLSYYLWLKKYWDVKEL